jgi:hypothetical protein
MQSDELRALVVKRAKRLHKKPGDTMFSATALWNLHHARFPNLEKPQFLVAVHKVQRDELGLVLSPAKQARALRRAIRYGKRMQIVEKDLESKRARLHKELNDVERELWLLRSRVHNAAATFAFSME